MKSISTFKLFKLIPIIWYDDTIFAKIEYLYALIQRTYIHHTDYKMLTRLESVHSNKKNEVERTQFVALSICCFVQRKFDITMAEVGLHWLCDFACDTMRKRNCYMYASHGPIHKNQMNHIFGIM